MTKNFKVINYTTFTNSLNEVVYNVTYSFTDEWNDNQICLATCYLHTDASTNKKFIYNIVFQVRDKQGRWNSRFAKDIIYTDDYNKNAKKHINFLNRVLKKDGIIF